MLQMCEVTIHQKGTEVGKSRYNGFSLPLHPFQIIAWIFLVYFNFMYFGVLAPSLPMRWHPSSYIIVGFIVLIHITALFAASIVNPVDNNVLKKYRKHGRRVFIPTFDRNQYRHVIENQFCHLCEVHVHIKSKHCSACNKCIEHFDHHCKWLNNCIGSKNYWLFFLCVVTALLILIFIFITSISHIIVYHEFPDVLLGITNSSKVGNSSAITNASVGRLKVLGYEVQDKLWLSLIGSCGILSSLAGVLIGQLVFLHIYLMCRGITTYEYIMQSRISGPLEKVESGEITTPKRLSDSAVGVGVAEIYENDCNNEVRMDKSSYEKETDGKDFTGSAKRSSVDKTAEHTLPNEDKLCEVAVVTADVHKIMYASDTSNVPIVAPSTTEGNGGKPHINNPEIPASKERKRRPGKRKKRSRVQDISTENVHRKDVEDNVPTDSAYPGGIPVHSRPALKTRGHIEKIPKNTATDMETQQSNSFTDLARTQTPNSQEKLEEIPVLSTACGALFEHSSRSDAEISVHRARTETPNRVSMQPNIDNGVPVQRMFPMVYVPLTPLALVTVDSNYALNQTVKPPLFHEDAQSFARGFVMGQQSARQHIRAEDVAVGSPR